MEASVPNHKSPSRWIAPVLAIAAAALGSARFLFLRADFPDFSRWALDQAKYTDEGWWSSAAVMQHLLGHWYMPGDYNPAVAVPVWPLLLSLLFRLTGVSLVVARALSVTASLATLATLAALVRRYARRQPGITAAIAALLLAGSPIAFVFSRLAILESLVVLEFCILLALASTAHRHQFRTLLALCLLIPVMLLTKTTAAVLVPAVLWLTWREIPGTARRRLLELAATVLLSAVLLKAWALLVSRHGFAADLRYFYEINQLEDIDWRQTAFWLWDLLKQCTWADRILYPTFLVILALSAGPLRSLWRNPLFTAAWLAFAGQAAYIFLRQGNYAPRYFLPLTVPVVIIVVLALDESSTHARLLRSPILAAAGAAFVFNAGAIGLILHQRTYRFWEAGASIARIVRDNPQHSQLLMGVSAADVSLMTALPAINDVYGTDPLALKIARYQPGWYLAWTGIGPEEQKALAGFRVQQVASYPAFDDADRGNLILYRLDALR